MNPVPVDLYVYVRVFMGDQGQQVFETAGADIVYRSLGTFARGACIQRTKLQSIMWSPHTGISPSSDRQSKEDEVLQTGINLPFQHRLYALNRETVDVEKHMPRQNPENTLTNRPLNRICKCQYI